MCTPQRVRIFRFISRYPMFLLTFAVLYCLLYEYYQPYAKHCTISLEFQHKKLALSTQVARRLKVWKKFLWKQMVFSRQPGETEVKYQQLLRFVLWIQRSYCVILWDLLLFSSKLWMKLCYAALWETTDQLYIGDRVIQLARVTPKWIHGTGILNLLTLYRQRFSLRKTHFLPLKRFLKCYDAKCH